MPFKSRQQEKFLFAKHPEIAKRWAKETPNIKSLPRVAVKKHDKTKNKKRK